jgi:hypothetical protein
MKVLMPWICLFGNTPARRSFKHAMGTSGLNETDRELRCVIMHWGNTFVDHFRYYYCYTAYFPEH